MCKERSRCQGGTPFGGGGRCLGIQTFDDGLGRFRARPVSEPKHIVAALLYDLDFVKEQLARIPDRAWLSRILLLGFASVWALFGALLCF